MTIVKDNTIPVAGTTVSWVAAISANQVQIEWTLKVASYMFAILVSVLTAAHIIKYWNNKTK